MDNVINWINNEIMRNQVYHNHKENMAWVATAFYITGAIILGIHLNNCDNKLIASIVALVVTGLAMWFVCWQFGKRQVAARRVKGLIKTAISLCKKDYPNLKWYVKERYLYPIFINDNIDSEHKQKDDLWVSKIISLSAMVTAFIIFLLILILD